MSSEKAGQIASRIRQIELDLYGPPEPPGSSLYYSNEALEARLENTLLGRSLAGLPLRTRSKVAKSLVCEALGYLSPSSFQKTRPRFPSPNFDLYVQKSNNLQVWNEEVDPTRRYVILQLSANDVITAVRAISGQELALLDTTHTLTSKYQAKRVSTQSALVSASDTDRLREQLQPVEEIAEETMRSIAPTQRPTVGRVLTIKSVHTALSALLGTAFLDPGFDQERLRGVELQKRVCEALNLGPYADGGQFPDILSQALEVKLQLSETVDLGLISPDSTVVSQELGSNLRYCDVRYALFYSHRSVDGKIYLDQLVVTPGQRFFEAFRRFEGNIQNRKLQIRLPNGFFTKTA